MTERTGQDQELLERLRDDAAIEHLRKRGYKVLTAEEAETEQAIKAALWEYWHASQAVQDGIIDFDLHHDAVTRLEKATAALALLAGGKERND